MATLPTNLKDDILDTSVNTRRRYRVYENTDGTIELEDVTEYSQVGDVFGAGQINSTNTEVNKKFDKNMLVRDLDAINAITKEGYAPDALALKEGLSEINDSLTANDGLQFQFAYDSESNKYGYMKKEADTEVFVPFSDKKYSADGLTFTNCEYVEGGICVEDGYCYFDLKIKMISTSTFTIAGLPSIGSSAGYTQISAVDLAKHDRCSIQVLNIKNSITSSTTHSSGDVIHIFAINIFNE